MNSQNILVKNVSFSLKRLHQYGELKMYSFYWPIQYTVMVTCSLCCCGQRFHTVHCQRQFCAELHRPPSDCLSCHQNSACDPLAAHCDCLVLCHQHSSSSRQLARRHTFKTTPQLHYCHDSYINDYSTALFFIVASIALFLLHTRLS